MLSSKPDNQNTAPVDIKFLRVTIFTKAARLLIVSYTCKFYYQVGVYLFAKSNEHSKISVIAI